MHALRSPARPARPALLLAAGLAALAAVGANAGRLGAARAAPAAMAAAPAASGPAALLAIVNEDSVTTRDLDRELALLRDRAGQDSTVAVPAADAVLRRLIQNCLLTQEGYRLGAERTGTVRNQVQDWVRRKTMGALLDSIAAQVPDGAADVEARRRAAVERYVEQLKKRYGARVDKPLLDSLDYASAEPQVQARLRDSQEVVASGPAGTLTVKELTQEIRFTYFHGLENRTDAAEIRDKVCDEWIVESVLRQEIKANRLDQRPLFRRAAREIERSLVRDEALATITSFTFKPTDKEIAAYYRDRKEDLRTPARIKVQSALLKDQASAGRFAERLRQGAKLKWLVERTPEVQAGVTPFPSDWLELSQLGLRSPDAVVGKVLEPYEVPGGWAVAVVTDVRAGEVPALETVRSRLLAQMKSERTRAVVKEALARLEAAARIRVQPDALALVGQRLAAAGGGQP